MLMNLMESYQPSTARAGPRILVCPSGFKESLEAHHVADCIEAGARRAVPKARIEKMPLVDGGEGFTKALVAVTGGHIKTTTVTGPVGEPISSHFGIMGGSGPKTAVVEMAAAAGLRLVPRDRRCPGETTTYGVGELLRAALDAGSERILLGCGDSGTCDGGIGMAQALGARFFRHDGSEIAPASGAFDFCDLESIDLSGLHPGLKTVQIDVACNWHNVLCGPRGVARVFGPQKGATKEEVERLSVAMDKVAAAISRMINVDVSTLPGSGASGGLGASLLLIGAQLHPRYDIIMQYLHIDELLDNCDLVITAEGGIDFQTPQGKIPAEVAHRAKQRGLPVIALAGTVGEGAALNYAAGIDAFLSIMQRPLSLEEAIETKQAQKSLTDSAESAMRMVMIGWSLNEGRMASAPTASAEVCAC